MTGSECTPRSGATTDRMSERHPARGQATSLVGLPYLNRVTGGLVSDCRITSGSNNGLASDCRITSGSNDGLASDCRVPRYGAGGSVTTVRHSVFRKWYYSFSYRLAEGPTRMIYITAASARKSAVTMPTARRPFEARARSTTGIEIRTARII